MISKIRSCDAFSFGYRRREVKGIHWMLLQLDSLKEFYAGSLKTVSHRPSARPTPNPMGLLGFRLKGFRV